MDIYGENVGKTTFQTRVVWEVFLRIYFSVFDRGSGDVHEALFSYAH